MNKELEEAKEILKTFKTRQRTINYNKISSEDVEAIETILQALDNSIPKEKILVKIKELDKIAKKKDLIPETECENAYGY